MSHLSRSPSRVFGRTGSLLVLAMMAITLQLSAAVPGAEAAPKPTNLQGVVPTITSIALMNGQLVASGSVTAIVHGTTTTTQFTGVPVTLSLAPNQSGATGCPILDLSLGPINLNLLGLVVQTSPICLTVTASQDGGALGSLLCQVGGLLNGGLAPSQVLAGQSLVNSLGVVTLPGLTTGQISSLLGDLTNLLNGALGQLLNSVLATITPGTQQHTCAILNLTVAPIDLSVLGLNVHLDNCSGGAVTVTITGQTGQGNLLGNLLCELLAGGQLQNGLSLQNILNLLVGLLTQ